MKPATKRPDHRGAVLVLTSVGGEAEARGLSTALVREGLAACVTRTAVQSVFRWDESDGGAADMPVCEEAEVLLLIKTSQARVDQLEKRVLELHPYECPELIRLEADHVEPRYLKWLLSACGGGGPADGPCD